MTETVVAREIDDIHVVIICPFCKRKHRHGSNGGKLVREHRTAHCYKGDYDIVVDNTTIKK